MYQIGRIGKPVFRQKVHIPTPNWGGQAKSKSSKLTSVPANVPLAFSSKENRCIQTCTNIRRIWHWLAKVILRHYRWWQVRLPQRLRPSLIVGKLYLELKGLSADSNSTPNCSVSIYEWVFYADLSVIIQNSNCTGVQYVIHCFQFRP